MTRFKTIAWIIALVLAPAVSGGLAGGAEAKPNIVFILADDMGYEDAGFMGSKEVRTPELDRLAKDGAILKSFYVQPVCSPTRAALMSGRLAVHTGVYQVVRPHSKWGLPLAERTLADALRAAGYQTAICGKWHLGEFEPAYLPTRRGFDYQYGHWFGAIDYFTHQRDGELDWHRDDKTCEDEGYSTALVAKEACRIIAAKPAGKPLFLYVPFNAVHGPYQVPEEYEKPFTALDGVRRTYAGMLAAMDEAVGRIVAALREKEILDDTLIIFSSDNGGPSPGKITSNGPLRAGKGTIYEGGIRVCAFASWPGHIPGGRLIDEPLQISDWFPTLVKLAGGSLEQELPLDGRDIWPVLTTGAKSPHDALFIPGMVRDTAALRMGGWKLVIDRNGTPELYDLATDIGEQHDLAGKHPDKVMELRTAMDRWLDKAVPCGEPAQAGAKKAGGKKKK